ncbi:MAG: SRPBCC family protein [Bacteroidetes bacterium]|nr:SRPBCC family protein [Bacteroidota bacterium]
MTTPLSLIILIGALFVGLTLFAVIKMPPITNATVEVRFDAPIDSVWQAYTDFESQTEWRADVADVTMAANYNQWTETLKAFRMTITFEVIEQIPPRRLVLKTGADGIFEGRYTAEFRLDETSTVGIFTEKSTVFGLIPKVMQRIFVNQKNLFYNM